MARSTTSRAKTKAKAKAKAKPTRPKPMKTKAARPRKAPPVPTAADDARGVSLVDRAVATIRAAGALPTALTIDGPAKTKPAPLAQKVLAKLTLADGKALPPSLARWLAFDGEWLPLRVDRKRARVQAMKFSELIAERASYAAAHLAPIDEIMLPGDCYPLLVPSDCHAETLVFMYAGEPDAHGELPVLAIDLENEPVIRVYAAGFDLYLARLVGVAKGYERANIDTFAKLVGPQALALAREHTLALGAVL